MVPATIAYHLASRLAYVIGVGTALTLQKRRQWFTRQRGVAAGYLRFRRIAATLMNNDAVSFVLMCWVTRRTLAIPVPPALLVGVGLAGIALGISLKLWARWGLGSEGYHWHDFFEPGATAPKAPPGPYRYLKNPMYTVGYLHAYGLALALGSLPGLILAGFAQLAILAFYHLVEKPHFKQLSAGE